MWHTLLTWWNHWRPPSKSLLSCYVDVSALCCLILSNVGVSSHANVNLCQAVYFSYLNKATAQPCCLFFSTSGICSSPGSPHTLRRTRFSKLYLLKTDVTSSLIAEWLKQERSEAEKWPAHRLQSCKHTIIMRVRLQHMGRGLTDKNM